MISFPLGECVIDVVDSWANYEGYRYVNHSSDIDFNNSMKTDKKCTAKPHSLLLSNKILPTDNSLYFRQKQNILDGIY